MGTGHSRPHPPAAHRRALHREQYGLEVTKGGVVVEEHTLADKDHYTFGRTPNNGRGNHTAPAEW